MIRIALVLSIIFGAGIEANAQSRSYQATISRQGNVNQYYIVNANHDSTLVTDAFSGEYLGDSGYQLKRGEGRKKDKDKVRGYDKRYMVNVAGDTTMTLYKGYKLKFNDGTSLRKYKTDNGWQFKNEQEEIVGSVNLLWNNEKWMVDLEHSVAGAKGDMFDHFVFANVRRWLSVRNDGQSEREDDWLIDDPWFILWLTSRR